MFYIHVDRARGNIYIFAYTPVGQCYNMYNDQLYSHIDNPLHLLRIRSHAIVMIFNDIVTTIVRHSS
jgi:hypothetical protein